jgi:CheY-like chemotaxis protein
MTVESPQVLVVDDSDIALEGMLQVLSDASIPAIGMPSAIGTTRAILRYKIRVVVVDVNMPVLTGNNLVSLFRNNPKLVGVKVLLVSGLPKPELLKMAAECGADGVVAKEDLDAMLVATIRRFLPKAPQSEPG